MTVREKRQAIALAALLGVFGLTLYLGYGRSPSAAAPAAAGAAAGTPQVARAADQGRIRTDLMAGASQDVTVGRANLFQYRNSNPPPPPPAPPTTPSAGVRPSDNPFVNPATPPANPPGPPRAPPPPEIRLRYVGAGTVEGNPEKRFAVIEDPDRRNMPVLYEGDYYLGKYRIARITEKTVEIEDSEYTRRVTLTITIPPPQR